MDNDIAYQIRTATGFLLRCKCSSSYYYVSKILNSIPINNRNNYTVMKYYKALCTNCNSGTNVYNIDTLIKTERITWITV